MRTSPLLGARLPLLPISGVLGILLPLLPTSILMLALLRALDLLLKFKVRF